MTDTQHCLSSQLYNSLLTESVCFVIDHSQLLASSAKRYKIHFYRQMPPKHVLLTLKCVQIKREHIQQRDSHSPQWMTWSGKCCRSILQCTWRVSQLSTRTSYLRTQRRGWVGSCCSRSAEASLEWPRLWCSCRCEPAAPGPWGRTRRPHSEPPWLRFPRRPARCCFLPECRRPRTRPASGLPGPTYYLQWRK